MAGKITDIRASFTNDLARPNRFEVKIFLPTEVELSMPSNIRGNPGGVLRYRCESAQLPGKTLATTEQKIYGPVEKYPYLTTYNDLDLTFIVSDDMYEKYVFDAWMEYINPGYTNNFRYKNEYAALISIDQYNVADGKTYSVDFFEAYPISMNQLDLDWSSDGYHKLTVTFAYTRWFNRKE